MSATPNRPNDPSGGIRRTSTSLGDTYPAFRDRRATFVWSTPKPETMKPPQRPSIFMNNACVFFASHGITQIGRVITDNGSYYRAADFTPSLREARHYRIRPYTPKHNGKVERYNGILAEELLYSREYTSEAERRTALSPGIASPTSAPHTPANVPVSLALVIAPRQALFR